MYFLFTKYIPNIITRSKAKAMIFDSMLNLLVISETTLGNHTHSMVPMARPIDSRSYGRYLLKTTNDI